MPVLSFTKNYSAGTVLTAAQLTAAFTSAETFFNSTKIDSTNIQTGGIATANYAAGSVDAAALGASAVTTAKINDAAVTAAKMAASTDVSARYTTAAGQAVSSGTIIDFATSVYDTNSLVTTGATWKFTAAATGKYWVHASVTLDGADVVDTGRQQLAIYKNGTVYAIGPTFHSSSAGPSLGMNVSALVALSATDYIDVRVGLLVQSGGTLNLTTTAVENHVSISLLR